MPKFNTPTPCLDSCKYPRAEEARSSVVDLSYAAAFAKHVDQRFVLHDSRFQRGEIQVFFVCVFFLFLPLIHFVFLFI